METFATKKLYYTTQYQTTCNAKIVEINIEEWYIITDQTVAFPEGWWQEGDIWTISLKNTPEMKTGFVDTKKYLWRPIYLEDFPSINVDTTIKHLVENWETLTNFSIWDEVIISINKERREKLTLSHTASHLLYIWVGKTKPEAIPWTMGCHIKENQARFDFFVSERFSQEEIEKITEIANEYVKKEYDIKVYSHEKEPEAIYWKCNWEVIPCGGTHLKNTKNIWIMQVRRKNIWKWKERIIVQFPDAIFDTKKYQD